MPEGDTIFRAARTLHAALAGRPVTRFESVFPQLTRVDIDAPLRGRTIDRVEARGKHLLMFFSGDLVLRTHMRMHGSWHIYRPGERWRRPRFDMRIVIGTEGFEAVGFNVPEAEFADSRELQRLDSIRELGPDLLTPDFDADEALRRIEERGDMEIADALLDQRAVAGIGNVYKSEVLFACRVNPFTRTGTLSRGQLEQLLAVSRKFLAANVSPATGKAMVTYTGFRRTTGRADPSQRLWVYGRKGQPCRRCGTPIERRKQGPHARSTYWCPRCQPVAGAPTTAEPR